MRIVWKLLKFLEIINVRFFSKNEFDGLFVMDQPERHTVKEIDLTIIIFSDKIR